MRKEEMMIIDCEVHLLHPEACQKNFIADAKDPVRNAIHDHEDFSVIESKLSVDALIDSMDQNKIQWSIIMAMPWKDKKNLDQNNAYIEKCVRKYPNRLRGMYIPHLENPTQSALEVKSLDKSIFLGVKILPTDQGSKIDDSRLAPIFEEIEKRNLFLMIHTDHIHKTDTGDTPFRLLNFLQKYPNIKTLAPHLGGLLCLYASRPNVKNAIKNVHFITSVSATMELVAFAAQINPNNLIFGTDFPFNHCHDQKTQIDFLSKLNLSSEDQKKILGGTAQRLFNLG